MDRFARQRFWVRWRRWRRQRDCVLAQPWLAMLALLMLLYGLWPFLSVWRLQQAVLNNQPQVVATWVDVTAIRAALRRRLNKDAVSEIGSLSDDFIDWLDAGIRYHGVTALEQLVTFEWVYTQLRGRLPPEAALFPIVMTSSFIGLRDFQVQLYSPAPLVLFLRLDTTGWRIVALYY